MTPVCQSSSYVQPELERHLGYEYARTQSPEALQRNVAAPEGGATACFQESVLSLTDYDGGLGMEMCLPPQ